MSIYEAIPKIIEDLTAIGKEKKNVQQGFMYRGIDDVLNTLHPLFAKHHVFVTPEVLNANREERQTRNGGNLIYSVLTVKYTFYAEDGSHVSAIVMGEGMDSADKSNNKAMAIAMKYAMFQTFCIPTEDDPDAETPPESVPIAKKTTKSAKTEEKPKSINCDGCGKPIEGYEYEGKQITVEKQIALSKARFNGRSYCRECAVALANAEKQAEKENEK